MTPELSLRPWTFLSNHGHVLICLALDPNARLRDVSTSVGITERAAQRIVSEHGGRLAIESKPGVGTAATVILPQRNEVS